jgi:hypothetical protein
MNIPSYISRSRYMLNICARFYIYRHSPPSNPECKIPVSKATPNPHLYPPQPQIPNPSYRECYLKPNIPRPHRRNRSCVKRLIHRRYYQRYAQQSGHNRRDTGWQEPPPFSFGHISVFLGRRFWNRVGCEGTRRSRCFSGRWLDRGELAREEVSAEDEVLD